MNREQAHEILMKYMKGENYILHSYAVEVIMKGLAKRLAPGEEEYWGIAGLLHDLDEEQCDWQNDMSVHGPASVEILKKEALMIRCFLKQSRHTIQNAERKRRRRLNMRFWQQIL